MKSILPVFALAGLMLGGCHDQVKSLHGGDDSAGATTKPGGGLDALVVGKYKGKLDVSDADVAKGKGTRKEADDLAKAIGDSMSLELKADKTYLMTAFMTVEGKWSITGSTINLEAGQAPKGPDGKQPEMKVTSSAMSGAVSADGKTITFTDPQGKTTSKMTFTQVAAGK